MAERISGSTKIWEVLNRILPSERKRAKESFIRVPLPGEIAGKTNIITSEDRPQHRIIRSPLQELGDQMKFENQTLDEVFGKTPK